MKWQHAILSALIVLGCLFTPTQASGDLDDRIGQAIPRMQNWLYSQQNADGSWGNIQDTSHHSGHGGPTAMAVQGLIYSGQSYQNERLQRAIDVLRRHPSEATYAVGVRAHIWGALPDEFSSQLQREAEWLLQARYGALFDYGGYGSGQRRTNRIDHSVTQYGALGLWEYAKRGGQVSSQFWEQSVQHFIQHQRSDGGWNYGGRPDNRPSYGSMTAAGLTVLYIAQQELYRDMDKPPAEVTESINRGLRWLDRNFSATNHPGRDGWFHYYLYSVERVGLASGLKYFNEKDWFEEGARRLLQQEGGNGRIGNGVVDTSFALMFLSRGRVPVWANKLQVTGKNWNNRPNDIYFLNQYLSDYVEQELNWQVVNVDVPARQWLNAPILFASSDEPLNLTDEQKANLKYYLDMGGTLVVNPEPNSASFIREMRQMIEEMYPGYRIRPVDVDHPIMNLVHNVNLPIGNRPQTLNNGVRDIAVFFTRDWSKNYQADREPGQTAPWKVMINLFSMVTNRARLDNRLVDPFEQRAERSATGDITIIRARYDGNWNPEPLAFEPVKTLVFNRTGLNLNIEDRPLEEIGSADEPLVLLQGVQAAELNEAQLQAIKDYVAKGGMIFVETVGGQGEFDFSLNEQLWTALDRGSAALRPDHALISGQGINGAFDCRRVGYRPNTVLQFRVTSRPAFNVIFTEDNRPAVIMTSFDLSLGSLGSRHWNVVGYGTKSSRELLTNLVLYAHHNR